MVFEPIRVGDLWMKRTIARLEQRNTSLYFFIATVGAILTGETVDE